MAGILIVEDEQIVALDIQNSLESNGFSVAGQADRGERAVKKAGELHPDLILMDIGLKGEIDGIEAAIQIKTQYDLPVIFLTAFGNPSIVARARFAEPFGYIIKPFDERELISNINMALYKHSMEKKLRESENKFRSVIEHSSDGIVLLDRLGNLIEWNPAVEQITGWNRSAIMGQPIWEVLYQMLPEKQRIPASLGILKDKWTAIIENEYSSGMDQVIEIEIQSSQGVRRIIQSNGFVIKTAQGTLAGAIMRDITENKRMEEERSRLLNVLEASINEIYVFDAQTLKFKYVNSGAQRNLGYSAETFLTFTPLDIKPEFTEADFRELIAPLLLHEKERLIFKTVHRRADQSTYPVEVHLQLAEFDGRSVFLAMINDITEREQAEVQLRKLSQAVEQSGNAIVITDIEGNIEYANPKFVEASGYSLSEAIGKNPRILRSGEHNSEFYKSLWETIKAGKIWRGEFHNRRKDGGLYWEDTTITPVYDNAHNLVNFIAVKEDITVRKMLAEAERDQRQLAEALRDISAALNSTLNLDEVLNRVLDNIDKLATFDAALVLLLEGHTVRKIHHRNHIPQSSLNQTRINETQASLINAPFLNEMIETRQPCLVSDTQFDVRWRTIPGLSWICSFIGAPVEIRGRVMGIINILSSVPGFFSPLHAERLMAFAGQVAIAIENAQLFEQAYYLSVTDPLTELNNRRHFFDVARLEFERAQRYKRVLSVMMLDVDHFKNINDTFGHAVGDLTLREIAARIKKTVRTTDVVARFGGEEFIVLMPETGLEEANQVAERVRHSVSDMPIEKEIGTIFTTLSIGVAEINEKCVDIDQLIKRADQALYRAKTAGRNRVVGGQNA